MDLDKLKELKETLTILESDFSEHHHNYKNGSNSKIRNEAGKDMDRTMNLALRIIKNEEDLVKIIVDETDVNIFSQGIKKDYNFQYSIGQIISTISEKIKEE